MYVLLLGIKWYIYILSYYIVVPKPLYHNLLGTVSIRYFLFTLCINVAL